MQRPTIDGLVSPAGSQDRNRTEIVAGRAVIFPVSGSTRRDGPSEGKIAR